MVKRPRLTDDEKKSVAYSPEAVVSCVRRIAQGILANTTLSVDLVVEPCAGDGRLGRAVCEVMNVPRAKKVGLLLFDVCPAGKEVKKLNVLSERDVAVVSKSMTGHKCLVVLNPPFNPKNDLRRICSASLGLEGANLSILVLPGVYRDPFLLGKLLPRWWHVELIENLDFQKFEQPLLNKTTSDLMLAIVFVIRKSYLRQTPVDCVDKLETQGLFQFVEENGDWDQAFQTGAIQHPIKIKMPGEIRSYGRWRFVKYLQCFTTKDTERICNLVTIRTAYATEKGIFPVHGTTDRISVSKEALCDWLNQVLTGDERFFQGVFPQNKSLSTRKDHADHNIEIGEADDFNDHNDLNDEEDDEDEHEHDDEDVESGTKRQSRYASTATRSKVSYSIDRYGEEEEEEDSVIRAIDVADVWCIELAESCKLRASVENNSNSSDDPFGKALVDEFKTKQGRVVQALLGELQGSNYEQCFFAGLKLQSVLKKSSGFGRGSRLDFCIRVLMGRALSIHKFSLGLKISEFVDKLCVNSDQVLSQKTLERYWNVYNRIMENGNLRFAWGGFFEKLSKNGGKLKRVIKKHQLDFGGPAPTETIETPRGPLCAVPTWFILCKKIT